MIKCIGNSLGKFLGPENQTQCFVHTVNLVMKSVLKPFDTQKSKDAQAFEKALAEIQEDTKSADQNGDREGKDDKVEEEDMDKDKDKDIATRLEPIRSMLLKVCLRPITLILTPELT